MNVSSEEISFPWIRVIMERQTTTKTTMDTTLAEPSGRWGRECHTATICTLWAHTSSSWHGSPRKQRLHEHCRISRYSGIPTIAPQRFILFHSLSSFALLLLVWSCILPIQVASWALSLFDRIALTSEYLSLAHGWRNASCHFHHRPMLLSHARSHTLGS